MPARTVPIFFLPDALSELHKRESPQQETVEGEGRMPYAPTEDRRLQIAAPGETLPEMTI